MMSLFAMVFIWLCVTIVAIGLVSNGHWIAGMVLILVLLFGTKVNR